MLQTPTYILLRIKRYRTYLCKAHSFFHSLHFKTDTLYACEKRIQMGRAPFANI